jgi:predicted membrane protein
MKILEYNSFLILLINILILISILLKVIYFIVKCFILIKNKKRNKQKTNAVVYSIKETFKLLNKEQ